jgi:hypothetical protein
LTLNVIPLLATPFTVTTTFPVLAPTGTIVVMLVALQLLGAEFVPLNATVLPPWEKPKLDPAMTTIAPMTPELGVRLLILGVTVKLTPLLAAPLAVTTTLPVIAPVGTNATILVASQLVMDVAVVPLNVTVLLPCVDPKLAPVIVTLVPTGPEVGDRAIMTGKPSIV